jgi:hypothetical protein
LAAFEGRRWCGIEIDPATVRQAFPKPLRAEESMLPPPKPELAKAEPTRRQRDRTIEAIKSFYPPDGLRPKGVSIAALTKRINKLPEIKDSEVGEVSEDTVGRALEAIKVDLKK